MKRFFKIVIVMTIWVMVTANMFAQSPEKMTYQAVVRDAGNNVLANQPVGMQISILQDSLNGNAVFKETHATTTNSVGLVNLEIGGGTIVSGSMTSIDWANGPYFIKTETDPSGGTNYTITGTSQLLSVPYALFAKTAGSSAGGGQTVIQNDSLILKDVNGVTRMILNPNTGTFKMMNNDTVWFQTSVNSPKIEYERLGVDNYLIKKEENGAMISELFQGSNLIARITESEYYDGSLSRVTKTEKEEGFGFNANTGVYEKVKETEKENTNGVFDKYSQNYKTEKNYNNGQLYSEVVTNKRYNELSPGNVIDNYEKVHYKFYDADGNIDYEEKVERDFKSNTYKRYNKNGNDWILMEETNNPTSGTHTTTLSNSSGVSTITQSPGGVVFSQSDANAKKIEYTFSDNKTQFNFVDKTTGNKTNIAYLDGLGGVNYGPNHAIKTNVLGETFTQNTYVIGDLLTTGTTDVYGNLNVSGTKNFRITHPTDTAKYLVHAAIESNEVLNVYSGNVTTDVQGLATVSLPDYFDEINTDFRYLLTVVGQTFARAIVFQEINAKNQFVIKTDAPNTKVSWQVTATRNDLYMKTHPFEDVINK